MFASLLAVGWESRRGFVQTKERQATAVKKKKKKKKKRDPERY